VVAVARRMGGGGLRAAGLRAADAMRMLWRGGGRAPRARREQWQEEGADVRARASPRGRQRGVQGARNRRWASSCGGGWWMHARRRVGRAGKKF